MEYFKVTDKVLGGDSYYIKFDHNDTMMNMTGKAEIIRCVKTIEEDTNEESYLYISEKHDLFDMNIVEIDYELEANDWAQVQEYVDKKISFGSHLQDFDPLVDKGIVLYGHMLSTSDLKVKIKEVEGERVVGIDMAPDTDKTDLVKMFSQTLLENKYDAFDNILSEAWRK